MCSQGAGRRFGRAAQGPPIRRELHDPGQGGFGEAPGRAPRFRKPNAIRLTPVFACPAPPAGA